MAFLKPLSAARASTALAVLIACAACTTNEPPPVITAEPIIVPIAAEVKPVALERVAVRLPRSKVIGELQSGLLCAAQEDITYRGGTVNLEPEIYADVFREELEAANYDVAGDPNSLFQDRDADRAELIIGGLIKDLSLDICYQLGDYRLLMDSVANAVVDVEWQVYSQLTRDVVYTVTTKGSANAKAENATGLGEEAVYDAFGNAARGRLAERDFYNLVTGSGLAPSTNPASLAPTVSTVIPGIDPRTGMFRDVVTQTRANVVTLFAGGGTGSGFYISDDLLLTNEHVVGGAQFVVVRTVTGRELVGEVLSTNAANDIALVRTEASGLGGLPLRLQDVPISSTVFVIGSPRGERNESTVSSGIVSAYRMEEGARFIQSDVNVIGGNSGGPMFDESGNVIGVTSWGEVQNGVTIGLNRFIPIADALAALNIQVSGGQS